MTATQALRKEVKKYVDKADDKSLRIVKAILKKEQEVQEEEDMGDEDWDDLPKEFQILLEEAIKETDEGGGMLHEEVVAKYPQWFRK
jgi:hypothetical protein